MSETTTVYLVATGEYSDYHVCGIYSTREAAERAVEFYASDNDIEEFQLDALPDKPPGLVAFIVKMDEAGNTSNGATRDSCSKFVETIFPISWGESRWMVFQVWARDAEHAVKIANERRIGLIASGEWTLDYKEWHARRKDRR